MRKGLTELVFVLDRSGSMCGLEADTVGGYNAMLEANRRLEGEANVSTLLFNHDVEVACDRAPLAQVPDLRVEDFVPCGCTALLDAVGGALRHTEKVQGILPEEHRAEHVLVAIATDGLENCSTRYTYGQVRRMMAAAQERGWEIVFMAANIDAAAEAGRLGIRPDRARSYEATPTGTEVMYDALCCAAASVRAGEGLDGWAAD